MHVDVDVAAAVGEVWFEVAVGPSPLLLFSASQLLRKHVEVPGKRWNPESYHRQATPALRVTRRRTARSGYGFMGAPEIFPAQGIQRLCAATICLRAARTLLFAAPMHPYPVLVVRRRVTRSARVACL